MEGGGRLYSWPVKLEEEKKTGWESESVDNWPGFSRAGAQCIVGGGVTVDWVSCQRRRSALTDAVYSHTGALLSCNYCRRP